MNRILVPLDGSKESEGAIKSALEHLSPDGELILLHVVFPAKTVTLGDQLVMSHQIEEAELSKARVYLKGVIREHGEDPDHHWCEAIIGDTVPKSIIDFATREDVDLIVMCTHDRKGIAGLIRRSVARRVERDAPILVKVIKPDEVPAYA
jgi:nucleotide-binding universal stress UspA family protein